MDIDLEIFQVQVEDELRALNTPGWLIEAKANEWLNGSQASKTEMHSLFPDPRYQEQFSEQESQARLKQKLYDEQELLLIHLIMLEPENKKWRQEKSQLREKHHVTPKTLGDLWQRRLEISEQKAKKLLAEEDICSRLCNALRTASNDSFEIAKIITPILVGLVVAGTISIPLLPILFASIALAITRMSIASLCGNNEDKEK